jgi:hypothetical protein
MHYSRSFILFNSLSQAYDWFKAHPFMNKKIIHIGTQAIIFLYDKEGNLIK